MDNKKAYLDSIAVKTKSPTGSPLDIFTPAVIKIIAVAVVLIIMLIVVGTLLASGNRGLQTDYEKLVYTFKKLNDAESPLEQYKEKLHNSDIRAINIQLQTSVANTFTQLKNAAEQIKVNPDTVANDDIDKEIGELNTDFEAGYYAGTLDITYANSVNLEISRILTLQNSVRSRTDNDAIATIIDASVADLTDIQAQVKNYIETH